MKTEKQFIKAVEAVETTIKRASNCRKKLSLSSCYQCDKYSSCKSFNYDDKLNKKRELEKKISNSWELEKKIRNV